MVKELLGRFQDNVQSCIKSKEKVIIICTVLVVMGFLIGMKFGYNQGYVVGYQMCKEFYKNAIVILK